MLFKYIVPFDIEKNKKHPTLETKTIRATTSVRANFLSILQEKTYFFYSIHPLLQNTLINLSILHIYSIKYSFFLHFLLFPSLSSLEKTHKLVFFVEPYPHPTNHPSTKSFNKIRRATPTPILQQNHPHPASHHLLRQATNPTQTQNHPHPATINDIKQK